MTSKTTDCPTCGAPISEIHVSSRTIICPYCDSVSENPYYEEKEGGVADGTTPIAPQEPVPPYGEAQTKPPSNATAHVSTYAALSTEGTHSRQYAVELPETSPSDRNVALFLCIFLGMFGVHRFYVGKIGTGLIWLCTVGCFFIGWIVDAVMISKDHFLDKEERPVIRNKLRIDPSNPNERVCAICGERYAGEVSCTGCGVEIRKTWDKPWVAAGVIVLLVMVLSQFSGGTSSGDRSSRSVSSSSGVSISQSISSSTSSLASPDKENSSSSAMSPTEEATANENSTAESPDYSSAASG